MSDPRKPKVFCPVPGEIYFFIRADQTSLYDSKFFDNTDPEDRNNFFLGNCFETIQDVMDAIEALQVRALLRYHSSQCTTWTVGTRIGSDCCQITWTENIGKKINRDFSFDCSSEHHRAGVYFPYPEDARNAIAQIGADRVKKYLGVKL